MIELIQADITTLDVDAIVNAANSGLAGGGGVDWMRPNQVGGFPRQLKGSIWISEGVGRRDRIEPAFVLLPAQEVR